MLLAPDKRQIMLAFDQLPDFTGSSHAADIIGTEVNGVTITEYWTLWIVCIECNREYKYREPEDVPQENVLCECGEVWIMYVGDYLVLSEA